MDVGGIVLPECHLRAGCGSSVQYLRGSYDLRIHGVARG